MLAKIKDILLITTEQDQIGFKRLFGNDTCDMILGDNIFYGNDVVKNLNDTRKNAKGRLKAKRLGGEYAWFDTGLTDSLLDTSNTIKNITKFKSICHQLSKANSI